MKLFRWLIPGAFLCSTAFASTIQYSNSISLTLTDWGPLNISLTQFNPALGTLNSVTFNISSTVSALIKFENLDTGNPNSITANLNFEVDFSAPDGSSDSLFFSDSSVNSGTLAANTNGGNPDGYTGADSFTTTATYPADSNLRATDSFGSGVDFSYFMGAGTFDLTADALATAQGSTLDDNFAALINTSADAQATVIYDYEAAQTPEPATFLISGCSIFGLVLYRRKRRT